MQRREHAATRPVAGVSRASRHPPRLQARGGQVWVLVESLSGGRVYDAFMEKGESKVLPLGTGLRIRSGRADLLFVSIGSDSPRALGGVSDLDWVEFRP